MNIYLFLILTFLVSRYVISLAADFLNIKAASPELPQEFKGYFDEEKYRKAQEYLKENTLFENLHSTFGLIITIVFIFAGGFPLLDQWSRSFGFGGIQTGLIFIGTLFFVSQIINLPFSAYHIFVIEQKYGFNKSTKKTFALDVLKSWILTIILGGVMLTTILWFFERFGHWAWLYAWVIVVIFQFFIMLIAPVIILPLFNKYVPLEDGMLKQEVESLAKHQNFSLKGVYKMDGSRRSTKTNAFFVGFGKFRRIALFDTLIAQHPVDEMKAILAHEIGHYKKGHILKLLILSVAEMGVMFYLLNLFINNNQLFAAFGMEEVSVYASLIFFSFLFAPVKDVMEVVSGVFSRRFEYEADRFAVEATRAPKSMIEALKKLSVHNLSNLTPHPLKVFLEYSHPPVLERINAINNIR